MLTLYFILSFIVIFGCFISLVPNPHWFFRWFDFARIQLLVLQLLVFIFGFLILKTLDWIFIFSQTFLLISIIYQCKILLPYTSLYKIQKHKKSKNASKIIELLVFNVYQFNSNKKEFIQFIIQETPDLILTMESDSKWQSAMQTFKTKYPYSIEIGLENTYGMHFYSRLEILSYKVHYHVANDIPSIEAELKTSDGFIFNFFGVHPPPPSPTEEENSKERDGELLSVAKLVKQQNKTTVVAGDFNNVAWAKSSVLFRKTSELIDPRIGRGLVSTFHAKYFFFRFPIDQIFHSSDIFVEIIERKKPMGSDHFPLYFKFYIDPKNTEQEILKSNLNKEEKSQVNLLIEEGKNQESNRESIAKE